MKELDPHAWMCRCVADLEIGDVWWARAGGVVRWRRRVCSGRGAVE